jgi:hypothetical protein
MLLCRGGNHHFIIRCIAWLSQGKTCLEVHPTRTDSGAAQTGGWTFHRIAPAWGAAATLMAGGRTLSLLRGGGREGRRPTSSAGVGWRRHWVAAGELGMLCTHCDWISRSSLVPLA